MDDFGHLRKDVTSAALGYRWGPKSVITFPSGSQKLPDHGWYEITGLAWSGQGAVRTVEISTDGGQSWTAAELKGTPHRMAHTRFGYMWNWDGGEHVIMSRTTDDTGVVQPSREQVAKALGVPYTPAFRVPGTNNTIMPKDRQRRERDQWARLGSSRFCCSWQARRSRRRTASGRLR